MRSYGDGARLLEHGWLTERAAAEDLGITVRQLRKRRDDERIDHKSVAPGVTLYNVRSYRP